MRDVTICRCDKVDDVSAELDRLLGLAQRKSRAMSPAFSLRRTLNADHGAGRMPRAGKRYTGARSRIAPKRGWPLLLFSRLSGKFGHGPLIPDTSAIRMIHVGRRLRLTQQFRVIDKYIFLYIEGA